MTTPGPDREAVVAQVENRAVALASADPSASTADLAPLRDVLADRSVVGLGESSHGSREQFDLKHRLLRFLVTECDLRLLGWEANLSASVAIDDYVRRGEGDPRDALADLAIHWPWRSEAVVDVLEWLRAFNDGRPPADRVRVCGLDGQFPTAAAADLRAFLREVDTQAFVDVGDALDAVADADVTRFTPESGLFERADRAAGEVGDRLAERRAEYVDAASERAVRRAELHHRTLAQALDVRREDGPTRDELLADNVAWHRERADGGAMAVWAHNAHVKRGQVGGGGLGPDADAMGEHLHRAFGDDYYALATELGGGSVRAHDLAANEFLDWSLDAPPAGSVPDVFGDVERPPFVLDVGDVRPGSPLAEWLGGDPAWHSVLGSFEDDPVNYAARDLREVFDAVAFVAESTPTTPTERLLPGLDL